MKRKFIIVLLSITMAFSLVSCGDNDAEKEEIAEDTEIAEAEEPEKPNNSEEKDTPQEDTIEIIDEYANIDKFIELYNESAQNTISDIIDADLQGDDYLTEFRTLAFEDAVGKKGTIAGSKILIVNYGNFSNDSIRIYVTDIPDDNLVTEIYKTTINVYDSTITEEEMMEEFDAASIYLGQSGKISGYVHKSEIFLDCREPAFISE